MIVGNAFVAFGEEAPLIGESGEGGGVLVDVGFFFGDVDAGDFLIHDVEDAVAGRAVETDVDVDFMFLAELDGAVDGRDGLFVDFHGVAGIGPEAVVHGEADPVEAPIVNPLEVTFWELAVVFVREIFHPVGVGGEIFEEIEAVPAGVDGVFELWGEGILGEGQGRAGEVGCGGGGCGGF